MLQGGAQELIPHSENLVGVSSQVSNKGDSVCNEEWTERFGINVVNVGVEEARDHEEALSRNDSASLGDFFLSATFDSSDSFPDDVDVPVRFDPPVFYIDHRNAGDHDGLFVGRLPHGRQG